MEGRKEWKGERRNRRKEEVKESRTEGRQNGGRHLEGREALRDKATKGGVYRGREVCKEGGMVGGREGVMVAAANLGTVPDSEVGLVHDFTLRTACTVGRARCG